VVAVATGLIATASYADVQWRTLAVLLVLYLVSMPALLNNDRARVSMGYSAGLASVVLLGPVGAALVGASAVVTGQRHLAPVKRLFNGAQFALCCYTAGQVYELLHGPHTDVEMHVSTALGPFVAADLTYAAVNLLLVGGILIITDQVQIRSFRLAPIFQLASGYVGYGMFGCSSPAGPSRRPAPSRRPTTPRSPRSARRWRPRTTTPAATANGSAAARS
jgi:hypothetical protein